LRRVPHPGPVGSGPANLVTHRPNRQGMTRRRPRCGPSRPRLRNSASLPIPLLRPQRRAQILRVERESRTRVTGRSSSVMCILLSRAGAPACCMEATEGGQRDHDAEMIVARTQRGGGTRERQTQMALQRRTQAWSSKPARAGKEPNRTIECHSQPILSLLEP
jgi:hypothetical protein